MISMAKRQPSMTAMRIVLQFESYIQGLRLPCLRWSCVSQETITANEEDDIRAAQGWDVLEPEKLDIEFVKEESVDNHSNAEEEVSKVRDKNQRFPSCSVAPGPKEKCEDYAGNLEEERWIFQRFYIKDYLFDQVGDHLYVGHHRLHIFLLLRKGSIEKIVAHLYKWSSGQRKLYYSINCV